MEAVGKIGSTVAALERTGHAVPWLPFSAQASFIRSFSLALRPQSSILRFVSCASGPSLSVLRYRHHYRTAIISTIWSVGLWASAAWVLGQEPDGSGSGLPADLPEKTAPLVGVTSPDSEQNAAPAGPMSPSSGQETSPSVFGRVSSLFESLPDLRLGPVDFQPRLSMGLTYDDNILISSHQAESDLIWYAQPAVLALAGDRLAFEEYKRQYANVLDFTPDALIVLDPENWPGRTFMFDYGPRFTQFVRHSENNSIDQLLSANLLWPFTKLMLGFHQDYRLENTTVVEAGRRSSEEIINTDLMSAYRFGEKTSAEFNVYRRGLYFQVPDLNGYTDWGNQDWFNYQIDPLLNIGTGISLGLFDVPGLGQETYQQFLGRARYQLHERVTFDASAGLALGQFETGGRLRTVEPVFNLASYYRPTDTTTFTLTGYRHEQPSVYFGANYVATGASLGFSQQFGQRYLPNLGLDYYVLDYLTTAQNPFANRSDNYLQFKLGLEIRFSHHLVGNVFYLFRSVVSNQWDGFKDNQVGAQLTLTY